MIKSTQEDMNKVNIQNKKINKEIDKFKKSGNIQKAIETCQGALLQDENNADLHIKLGDLYMEWHLDIHQVKQYADEAITEYQRALESCVDSAEIYYKIAMAIYYKSPYQHHIDIYYIRRRIHLPLHPTKLLLHPYLPVLPQNIGKWQQDH